MDILDIDEVLNDESFCLLTDNSQDDVTNILQQWKMNSSSYTAQGTKLDTRTFTRPKRKSAQNLEGNFTNIGSKSDSITNNSKNNVNLKIGGLVTGMQKSFLSDISPPSSICSSMDMSTNDNFNNSLITSGDFTNVSFFKTETEDVLSDAHYSGYSLSDVIKDRKILENLSLSGDSTIIKDLNIAQTDEINYLSKTNSGNSTMNNSTDSMNYGSILNETFIPFNTRQTTTNSNKTFDADHHAIPNGINCSSNDIQKEIVNVKQRKSDANFRFDFDDDLIKNTTFSLIDSITSPQKTSVNVDDLIMNATTTILNSPDFLHSTFSKNIEEIGSNNTFNKDFINCESPVSSLINRTFNHKPTANIHNETYDFCEEGQPEVNNILNVTYNGELNINSKYEKNIQNETFDGVPGTPLSEKKSALNRSRNGEEYGSALLRKQQSQSTPQQKPSSKSVKEEIANISPIVPGNKLIGLETVQNTEIIASDGTEVLNGIAAIDENERLLFVAKCADPDVDVEEITSNKVELLEKYLDELSSNFPDKNKTIEIFVNEKLQQNGALNGTELIDYNIEDGITLLTENEDENDFDEILDRLSRSTAKEENIKMKRSLDNIKKRYSLANYDKQQHQKLQQLPCEPISALKPNGTDTECHRILSDSMTKNSLISSSGSERLLSRRSRLFDDIQLLKSELNTAEVEDNNKKGTTNSKTDSEDNKLNEEQKTDDIPCEKDGNTSKESVGGKLQRREDRERDRDRDRDRFKTIRIFRNTNDPELNVPCIDGEVDLMQQQQLQPEPDVVLQSGPMRFSRKDNNSPTLVFNNNKSETEHNIYTTYKKPRESYLKNSQPSTREHTHKLENDSGRSGSRQRSLSRPKYFSALTKTESNQNDLPKASSAGDLEQINSSKSIKNSGNFGFANKFSQMKPSSQPSLLSSKSTTDNEKSSQLDRSGRTSLLSKPSATSAQNDNKNGTAAFKIPQPISNLRPTNSRRTGLVRPSSGFYSYNVTRNDSDTESGRYSPSNSLSSASSKGSIQDIQQKIPNGHASDDNLNGEHVSKCLNETIVTETHLSSTANKSLNINGKTTIPKPSGLRPPSNIRRSGLPRLSTTVKR